MKKILTLLLAAVMVLSLGAVALAEDVADFKEVGVTVTYPAEFHDLAGTVFLQPYGNVNYGPDIYYMPVIYVAMSRDDFNAFNEMDADEVTEEMVNDIYARMASIANVLVSDADIDTVLEALGVEDEELGGLGISVIGEADGYNFFYVSNDLDAISEGFDAVYAEDVRKASEVVYNMLTDAELYAPIDLGKEAVGQVFSFETTDVDGNPITSEELFAANEITMINYWGTWCHNCVDEMEELAEIHTRLQAQGCGVIGILEDVDKLDRAKEIMAEKGTNYPVVLQSEDMDVLENVTGYPSTFFVDKTGTVLCPTIVGADVEAYEKTIQALLAGEDVSSNVLPAASGNDDGVYRIYVVDNAGEPVKGAVIQFCDDTSCNMGKTNDDGIAEFNLPEGPYYQVHILKAPEGYEPNTDEYRTLPTYSDVVIVLNKAA